MKKTSLFLCLIAIAFIPIASWSQQEDAEPDHSYKPMQFKLNEDGSKYMRFITWHQMWLQGGSEQQGPKFSIRRSGVLAYAQISPRFLILGMRKTAYLLARYYGSLWHRLFYC